VSSNQQIFVWREHEKEGCGFVDTVFNFVLIRCKINENLERVVSTKTDLIKRGIIVWSTSNEEMVTRGSL